MLQVPSAARWCPSARWPWPIGLHLHACSPSSSVRSAARLVSLLGVARLDRCISLAVESSSDTRAKRAKGAKRAKPLADANSNWFTTFCGSQRFTARCPQGWQSHGALYPSPAKPFVLWMTWIDGIEVDWRAILQITLKNPLGALESFGIDLPSTSTIWQLSWLRNVSEVWIFFVLSFQLLGMWDGGIKDWLPHSKGKTWDILRGVWLRCHHAERPRTVKHNQGDTVPEYATLVYFLAFF